MQLIPSIYEGGRFSGGNPDRKVLSMANNIRSMNKKQRCILWGVGIALLIGIVSMAVSLSSGDLPAIVKDGPIPTYTGHLRADQFKHPHPDEDVRTDAAYMELDRRIHIRRGAETVPVETAEDARLEGEASAFFARYFEIVTAGDASAYNSLFTDTYYKRTLPFEFFSRDMAGRKPNVHFDKERAKKIHEIRNITKEGREFPTQAKRKAKGRKKKARHSGTGG